MGHNEDLFWMKCNFWKHHELFSHYSSTHMSLQSSITDGAVNADTGSADGLNLTPSDLSCCLPLALLECLILILALCLFSSSLRFSWSRLRAPWRPAMTRLPEFFLPKQMTQSEKRWSAASLEQTWPTSSLSTPGKTGKPTLKAQSSVMV